MRLREERSRLGFSQTDFAALAGAKKGTQISWEKDASSPTAQALMSFYEAGADALYILTGRRTNDRPDNAVTQIEDQLDAIRRDVLDPSRRRLADEDDQQAEERVLAMHKNALQAMLRYDTDFLTTELREEVEHLLDIVDNPASLSLLRAADRMQLRKKREQMKRRLSEWFADGTYQPGETVTYLLTTLAMEYDVPVRLLVELTDELHNDVTARSSPPSA